MLIRNTLLVATAIGYFFTASFVQAGDRVTTVQVTDHIYMLQAKGGNIGLFLGTDGTFLVDDQFANLTDKILAAIKSVGGDTPRFLINTHYHGDHTGGNENLGKAGTLIFSHDNVRERLVKGSYIKAFDNKTPPANAAALPVLTFSESMHFHINDDSVNAVHMARAHTDGDSFIHFRDANVVHAGDLFFNGFYPFIDAAAGGSVKGVIDAVDSILAITDSSSKIIPGHGPLGDKAQLQSYRDMLDIAYRRLLALKNQDVSAADAVLEEPLKDLEKQWGGGLFSSDKWIEVVYPAVY